MNSKILLRMAAVLMLLHSVGHTSMSLMWRDSYVPKEVVQKMQDVQFRTMYKADITMADFFTGASCFGIILVLFIAVLLWILSGMKDKSAVRLLWIVEIAIILHAVVELIYYFPVALIFCVPSAILVFIAILGVKKLATQQA
jgi:hypothetical protein